MSIRYFEIYQESDRDEEKERYLCSNRDDAITMANGEWWGMSEFMRDRLDYFCVEEFDVDDDFGERSNEVVVRTWKPASDADFAKLSEKNTLRALVNIANTYSDTEYNAFVAEVASDKYCGLQTLQDNLQQEALKIIKTAWEKSRNGGNY